MAALAEAGDRPVPLGRFACRGRVIACIARETRAQAVVEMAVVAPVLIVVAVVVYNLMTFAAAVSRFDRVAPDIVLAQAVSPAVSADALQEVESELERAMEGYEVEVEVEEREGAEGDAGDALISLAAGRTTYVCALRYAPVPSTLGIAGVQVQVPAFLVHEREVTVDPWRSGVVV